MLLVFSGFYGRKNVFPCPVFSTYLSVARLPAPFLPSFESPSAKTSHFQKHLGTWLEGSFKVACNLWCSWKGSPFQFDKTHLTLGCQFHLELIFSSHLHHLVLNFARQRSLTLFPWVSILQYVVVLSSHPFVCLHWVGLDIRSPSGTHLHRPWNDRERRWTTKSRMTLMHHYCNANAYTCRVGILISEVKIYIFAF